MAQTIIYIIEMMVRTVIYLLRVAQMMVETITYRTRGNKISILKYGLDCNLPLFEQQI